MSNVFRWWRFSVHWDFIYRRHFDRLYVDHWKCFTLLWWTTWLLVRFVKVTNISGVLLSARSHLLLNYKIFHHHNRPSVKITIYIVRMVKIVHWIFSNILLNNWCFQRNDQLTNGRFPTKATYVNLISPIYVSRHKMMMCRYGYCC